MNKLERFLQNNILAAAEGDLRSTTPGLCVQVVEKGRKKADLRMGETYKYYDLASLTKIIFTVPAIMQLVDEKRININDTVSSFLKWWPHRRVTLGRVLSHSAGLPWWVPFYKSINLRLSIENRREAVRKILLKECQPRLGSGRKAVYSDLDFVLLGFVLEEIWGESLHEIWRLLGWRERTPSLHFNLGNKPSFKRSDYAPTEKCPWRKKTLRGEVHDDNTWSFGGVSTHAGLFGAIDDVTEFGMLMRESYQGLLGGPGRSGSSFLAIASPATVRRFCRRAVPVAKGDWALGFMLPSHGSASCGQYFHATSFGHTGFTGTSLWYDPRRDLLVTILSNRVHPTRDNESFRALRPQIHNWIVEGLS